jgi:hypothetical protein
MATQLSFMNRLKQFNPFSRKNNGSTASSSFFNYFKKSNKPSFFNRIFKRNQTQNNYRTRPWMRPRSPSINLNNNSGKASPSFWNRINPFKTTLKKKNAPTWNGRVFAAPPLPPLSENEFQARNWQAKQHGYNGYINNINNNLSDNQSPRRNNRYNSLGGKRTRKSRH